MSSDQQQAKPKTRGDIRTAIFSSKKFKTELVTIFGAEIEVRQPSLGVVLEASDESKSTKDSLIDVLIGYCFVPGTAEHVFEDTDRDALMKLPMGDDFNLLNKAIARMTGIDIEGAEKN